MKTIFKAEGLLNKGFVGQISYTVCLDLDYRSMDIGFSFDKQHYTTISEEMKSEISEICKKEYGMEHMPEEELIGHIQGMKTEIHTLASMNDEFIGGIHKQLTTRHMIFSPEFTSEGCIPQTNINGVIKITLLVFNVLQDQTHYEVELTVE